MGLPAPTTHLLARYAGYLDILRTDCTAILAQFNQENNLIYFSAIPDALETPALPSGTNMVTLEKYDYSAKLPPMTFYERDPDAPAPPAPSSATTPEADKTATKPETAAGGPIPLPPFQSGSASAPPPPPYAPGSHPRSDEDLAKDLQRRLDMGENI